MTDIANEPDDQMSMVRFLVYANHFDVEGLVATTSTWMKNRVRPDVIHTLLDAYARVQPNLPASSGVSDGRCASRPGGRGQPSYGMAAVGADRMSPGAELIVRAADRSDSRPLWVLAWGGTNTLAQALWHVRATRTPEQLDALVARLRVYAISDQDDAGPWLRQQFPALHYIAMPSTQDGEEYAAATWTGISGDRFYKNGAGADFTTFTDDVGEHQHSREGSARRPLPVSVLHSRGRHAGVHEPYRQRAGIGDEPGVWRVGRPLRVAAAVGRTTCVLDAGRRLLSGP